MKKVLLVVCVLFAGLFMQAQSLNPVSWSFSAKKISDKVYEVVLTATIQKGWHLYAQNQPADAINMPTVVKFNANPLVVLTGKTIETGKLEFFQDKKLKLSANQYSDKVVFTQKVTLKAKAKTNIGGSVEFQTCDDKKCLPPKTVPFSISLK